MGLGNVVEENNGYLPRDCILNCHVSGEHAVPSEIEINHLANQKGDLQYARECVYFRRIDVARQIANLFGKDGFEAANVDGVQKLSALGLILTDLTP